jgi:hypothetical protein
MQTSPRNDRSGNAQAQESPPPDAPVVRRGGKWQVTSYGDQRVCTSAGCGTLLSRYNGSTVCAYHDARIRSERP